MQQNQIWIYKIPTIDYLIAKRLPFSYQIPRMDSTGSFTYQIVNGVNIDIPVWEHIVKDNNGYIWATFQNNIYNVTDIYT